MKWNLGFPANLVADGEYPVLSRGQEIDSFALEFHPRTLRSVQAAAKQATLSVGCDYRIVAQVLYISDEACLLDFGLLAVCSLPGRDVPRDVRAGSYVAGVIYVGIPLCIPTIPEQFMGSLKHRWRIESISANITPLVETINSSGQKFRRYDESKIAYEGAESTNTGAMDYVLHCELLINLTSFRSVG